MYSDPQADRTPIVTAPNLSGIPGAVGAGSPPPGGTPAPLASIRRHPFVAMAVFAVAMSAGASWALKKTTIEYATESEVYVSPVFVRNLREDRDQDRQYSNYVQQQMLTIKRYDIIASTLASLKSQGIVLQEPGQSEQMAVEDLRHAIDVNHPADTYQITIGMRSKRKANLAEIVNCLTTTFIRQARSEEIYGKDIRASALNPERGALLAQLNSALAERDRILGDSPGASPGPAAAGGRLPASDHEHLAEATRKRVEAEARLAQLERGSSGVLKARLDDPEVVDKTEQARLAGLEQRRSDLRSTIVTLAPKHPDYQAMKQELAYLDEQLRVAPEQQQAKITNRILTAARSEVELARAVENQLRSQVDAQSEAASHLSKDSTALQDLGPSIDRLRAKINAIDDRLAYFRIEGSAPGYLRLFSEAREPLPVTTSNSSKYLMVVFAASLILSFGSAIVVDLANDRILTSDDVERTIGFRPLGIALAPAPETGQFEEEHFVRLVNGVERVFRRSKAKIMVFTSISPRRGGSRLVESLGLCLHSRGIRTITINANTFRVQESGILSLPDANPTDILRDEELPGSRALTSEGMRTPAQMTVGPGGEHRAEYPLRRFNIILQEISKDYELILVEAPPLLLSADAEYLSTISEATFLIAEAGCSRRRDLKRAAKVIEKIQTAAVGVILDRVSLRYPDNDLRRSFREYRRASKRMTSAC